MDEFVSLLHDRQVGRELRIEHLLEAKPPKPRDHLPGHQTAGVHPHCLADPDANGRGGLHHHDPVGVGEFLEHRVGVVTLDDRTRWAHNCALAAVRAGDVAETAVEESGDNASDAALRDVDRAHRLHVGAHRNAAAAQDALVGVPDDGRGGRVPRKDLPRAHKPALLYSQVRCDGLQFAVLVPHTRQAFSWMICQKKLDGGSPRIPDPGGVGGDLDPLTNTGGTGADKRARSLHFDHADAA